jgi:co-chaperonin GroES (HSP10)
MIVKATKNKILAEMIDKPDQTITTQGGIILTEKDATENAVRPRWFKVYSVGSEIDFIKEGEYVMVAHGRWSNGLKINEDLKLYLIDNDECLAVNDTNPMEDNTIAILPKSVRKRPSDDTSRVAVG